MRLGKKLWEHLQEKGFFSKSETNIALSQIYDKRMYQTRVYRWHIDGFSFPLKDVKSVFNQTKEEDEELISYYLDCLVETMGHIDLDKTAIQVVNKVNQRLVYLADSANSGRKEDWNRPIETHNTKKGDCISNYEEIYTKDGIKKVGELKEGDIVLSYDFNKKGYCYKPLVKIWEKGELPIKRVHLRNGQYIDITDNHPLWVRTKQKDNKYEKKYLKDIDLTKWWKRKLPIAKKIPYEITKGINDWLDEDLMFVIGHYLAEGWKEKHKVQSSGYELIEYIIPILERKEIPFTEYKNNSGVPCIRFLKSDFKEYLKTLKENSFDIHLPEHIFHQTKDKLKALLDGFYLGDGHNGNYKYPNYVSHKQEIYSTSSEQLARDIQRIGLQMGKTFHIWKQENHQGLGNKPIWRITYNTESYFLKDYGYKDISEVSISWIEDLGMTEMRDFEVKDTHTFIFKNGLISHQCEDYAILSCHVCGLLGIPQFRRFVRAGYVTDDSGNELGHATFIYLSTKTNEFYALEGSFYPARSFSKYDEIPLKNRKEYGNTWFIFNEETAYGTNPLVQVIK